VSFVERGSRLLRDGGLLGFIVPNKFFRTDYGVGLRSLLSRERAVARIVDFQASQVFAATTYTCLLFLKRGGADHFDFATSEASPPRLEAVTFSRKKASELLTDDEIRLVEEEPQA
jgi:Eco57I restriction-modification methylase